MKVSKKDDELRFCLEGRIDSTNVSEFEGAVKSALESGNVRRIVFDASDLEYISSAGLRVIMQTLKRVGDVTMEEASPAVYDVFEMTGITQIMDVRRKMQRISVDGLEMIGAGANGRVYRLDNERVVKVYNPLTNPLEKIAREKRVARESLILGIPSALSFEMVRVGEGYGIVYEMIDAMTLGEAMAAEPERIEEHGKRMAQMAHDLHATEFTPGVLPDARDGLRAWVDVAARSDYFTDEAIAAGYRLVDSIPPRNTFVHGDLHPGNIMVTGDGEYLLIDMGDAAVGDPVIDLVGAYQIMRVVADQPGGTERYTKLSSEQSIRAWNAFARAYYETDDSAQVEAIERKLKFYMIPRSMGGITFSEVIPDEVRKVYAAQMSKVLLERMPA